MKKIASILLLILVFAGIGFAQKKESGITWTPTRFLTWDDFKGHPEMSMPFDAQTEAEIGTNYEKVSGDEMKFKILVNFDIKKSWVKKKAPTDKLLAHEQCHFDIFEIYGRLYMKKLLEAHVFEDKKFSEKAIKIFEKNFKDLGKFQEQYDKETDHSKNEEKQKEWSEKIKALLAETEEYASKEITFTPKH